MTRELVTYRSALRWAPDGATITKFAIGQETMPLLPARQHSLHNEHRIARLLAVERPPVRTPRLIHAEPTGVLTFEAINAVPLGPKLPRHMTDTDLARAISAATALSHFTPRRYQLCQLPVAEHLQHHRTQGILPASGIAVVEAATRACGLRWRFAHGDLTARNLLKRVDGTVVVIDWERAGLYPEGYDLAVLWYTTAAIPGARSRIEALVPAR